MPYPGTVRYPTDDRTECYSCGLAIRPPEPQEGAEVTMVGKTYLMRGEPVVVLVRWRTSAKCPRNVLVQLKDGSTVVRPFRGLRKMPEQESAQGKWDV